MPLIFTIKTDMVGSVGVKLLRHGHGHILYNVCIRVSIYLFLTRKIKVYESVGVKKSIIYIISFVGFS